MTPIAPQRPVTPSGAPANGSPGAGEAVLVSVLLPTHNRAARLERAVRSILDQTLRELECIVIDDGSDDGTAALLRTMTDARLSVLRQVERGGVARALNRGLASARGRYVARMDSDDVSRPNRLDTQFRWLEAHPDIAVCGTAVRRVDATGGELGRWPRGMADEEIRAGLFFGNQLAHPTIMARRGLPDFVYRPETEPAEDYDLWLRLSRRHRFHTLAEPLLDYCEHADAASQLRREEQQAADRRLRMDLIREIWPEAPAAPAAALCAWVREGVIAAAGEPAARELMAELVRRNGRVARLPQGEFARQAAPYLPGAKRRSWWDRGN